MTLKRDKNSNLIIQGYSKSVCLIKINALDFQL